MPNLINYLYDSPITECSFLMEFNGKFSKNPRYNASAISSLLELLDLIQGDLAILDIRWAAYMLATVMWETTVPTTIMRPANKKGKPLLDKTGKPIMLKHRAWLISMAPVTEIGRGSGRRYHEAVKVKLLPDGDAMVTEQDGDQFRVSAAGVVSKINKGAVMGTLDGGNASKKYEDDDGVEQAYFGRGYVQLTWWSNYAKSSVALGKRLDLLIDPELVKNSKIAYQLMSHGMRTGKGFSNGHRFSDYFTSSKTDYVGARKMVNGSDHARDIADLALQFESILLKSRYERIPSSSFILPGITPKGWTTA